jgi:hypothetical protein
MKLTDVSGQRTAFISMDEVQAKPLNSKKQADRENSIPNFLKDISAQ